MPRKSSFPPSRARASLPDLYPLEVPRSEPAGRTFVQELDGADAVYAGRAYALVWAWCGRQREPTSFGAAEARMLVRDLAAARLGRDPRSALVLLARQLAKKQIDPQKLALACLVVGDCAVACGARQSALLWSEIAAAVVPWNPRFAWLAGKLHRKWDSCRQAEYWFQRAIDVAVSVDDRYTQVLALNSMGNLHLQTGNYALASERLNRALQRARRHRLHELQGPILHDLLLLAVVTGRFRDAEKYGALAFARYGAKHPNLPKLACDLAYSWLEQGFFERALGLYEALLPNFKVPDDRLHLLAAMVRCAGAIGSKELFDRYWTEAWANTRELASNSVLPSTLVDLAKGALSMSEWGRAAESLHWAISSALESGQTDVLAMAEAALDCVQRHRRIDRTPRHRRENAEAERLAEELKKGLYAYHTGD